MLDVIADFWKPAKRPQSQVKLQPELLQIGSSFGFGFVPQAMLSGRRLHVNAINTYQFGDETLTSFVLSHDKEANLSGPSVSMIVAESDGEYYLAISRRISLNDRMKLFDGKELENITSKNNSDKAETIWLACRDNAPDFKGWVIASYKREIQGLRGNIIKGDFRTTPLSVVNSRQEFEYTLLVSDSNEYAIEIEKYGDGRVEVYATVYRRMSDVGEITYPTAIDAIRPDVKIASAPELLAKEPLPVTVSPVISTTTETTVQATPIKLQEFTPTNNPAQETKLPMTSTETTINGVNNNMNNMNTAEAIRPKLYVQSTQAENAGQSVEIKPAAKTGSIEGDVIECDLRVANKIIDEAIRNEMRLTDVVRRIIELPVANPESVQIPLMLTDEDYALLSIRYGISSSDRNAIKRRVVSDLGDFSDAKKKAA